MSIKMEIAGHVNCGFLTISFKCPNCDNTMMKTINIRIVSEKTKCLNCEHVFKHYGNLLVDKNERIRSHIAGSKMPFT